MTIRDCRGVRSQAILRSSGEEALPELRKDPITGRWVIISTDRAKRPIDFVRESVRIEGKGFCPFCYGNEIEDSAGSPGLWPQRRRAEHARLERSRGPQ